MATTFESAARLDADTRLQDLNLIDFQVDEETPCENVVRRLEDDPSLCGVVVTRNGGLQGMMTRRSILEWMLSRPYGLDVFLKRPISSMVEFHQRDFIHLPGGCTVVEAAALAFQRPEETIYDPVVVQIAEGDYRLLDVPVLLVAQAEVHLATQRKLQEQQERMQSVLVALQMEKNRSQQYARDLERQKAEILSKNLALEEERRAAQERSEQLAALNQRLIEIGAVLSQKGKSAFQATFAGVEAVRRMTETISLSSQELSQEVREINTITDLIVEVAGHIRLLSFNAAVEANRSGSFGQGFTVIAQEIRKLAGRTTEASSRIRGIAERIQRKSTDTVSSAENSRQVVQTLTEKAQNASEALGMLEALLVNMNMEDPNASS